jgi:hypothetical protein
VGSTRFQPHCATRTESSGRTPVHRTELLHIFDKARLYLCEAPVSQHRLGSFMPGFARRHAEAKRPQKLRATGKAKPVGDFADRARRSVGTYKLASMKSSTRRRSTCASAWSPRAPSGSWRASPLAKRSMAAPSRAKASARSKSADTADRLTMKSVSSRGYRRAGVHAAGECPGEIEGTDVAWFDRDRPAITIALERARDEKLKQIVIEPALQHDTPVAIVMLPIERRRPRQQGADRPRQNRAFKRGVAILGTLRRFEIGLGYLAPDLIAQARLDEVSRKQHVSHLSDACSDSPHRPFPRGIS